MSITALLFIAAGLALVMAGAWAVQRATGNSGWIDTIWSFGVGLGVIAAAVLADGDPSRRWAIAILAALWSARLAGHIAKRSAGAAEDPRYAALIEEWGPRAPLKLFLFLEAQAVAAFVLALSAHAAAANPLPFGQITDWIAIALGVAALSGEALADAQLSRFRKESKGRRAICEVGLWRYSRHPNYFFEWLFWVSLPLIALSALVAAPFAFVLALAAPAMMYRLLVHVSGIPPLEAHMLATRGDAFRAYQNRVNAFFPGPRRT